MSHDDAEKLRLDDAEFDQQSRDEGRETLEGSLSFVGKTVAISSYPSTAGKFYGVLPQTVTGDETEGASGTLTALGSTAQLALHVGSTAPPVNTEVFVTFVNYRYSFEY